MYGAWYPEVGYQYITPREGRVRTAWNCWAIDKLCLAQCLRQMLMTVFQARAPVNGEGRYRFDLLLNLPLTVDLIIHYLGGAVTTQVECYWLRKTVRLQRNLKAIEDEKWRKAWTTHSRQG